MGFKTGLKKVIKKSAFLSALGYHWRAANYKKKCAIYHNEPVDRKKVIFCRAGAGYGDHTRSISEYLHAKEPDIKQVWACSSKEAAASLPAYVEAVDYESDAYFKTMSTSSVWVFTTLVPYGMTKKKDQLYIQTWHGDRAFKKIMNDAKADNANYRKATKARRLAEDTICDYFVTASTFAEKMYRSAMSYSGAFLKAGSPRNDCLFDIKDEDVKRIREQVGIAGDQSAGERSAGDQSAGDRSAGDRSAGNRSAGNRIAGDRITGDEMILIYAPTFRDAAVNEGSVESDIDLISVLDRLEEKYGRKWLCLKRAHSGAALNTLNRKTDPRIIDVTKYPDMADLMMISDMLLTDYSSCATDFVCTGRPVVLYQDDIDTYTTRDRSLLSRKLNDAPSVK